MSLITMDELDAFMDDDSRLPDEVGGVYLGYQVGWSHGLLCNECATEVWLEGEEVTPEIVSLPLSCVRCGIPIGDERFEDYLAEHVDADYLTASEYLEGEDDYE